MANYIYEFDKEFLKKRLDQFIDHMVDSGINVDMDGDICHAGVGNRVACLRFNFLRVFNEIEKMEDHETVALDINNVNDVKWLIVYGDLEARLSERIKYLEDQLKSVTTDDVNAEEPKPDKDDITVRRIKRFAGLMPVDDVEKEQIFSYNEDDGLRIQAGPKGWSIIYDDGSSEWKDNESTTNKNFAMAMNVAIEKVGPIIPCNESHGIEVCNEEDLTPNELNMYAFWLNKTPGMVFGYFKWLTNMLIDLMHTTTEFSEDTVWYTYNGGLFFSVYINKEIFKREGMMKEYMMKILSKEKIRNNPVVQDYVFNLILKKPDNDKYGYTYIKKLRYVSINEREKDFEILLSGEWFYDEMSLSWALEESLKRDMKENNTVNTRIIPLNTTEVVHEKGAGFILADSVKNDESKMYQFNNALSEANIDNTINED